MMAKSDNSVDTDNDAYVGVDDIYKNDAYGASAPLKSEDDDVRAAEEAAVEAEKARLEAGVGFLGYNPDTVHPSEKENADDQFNRDNRAIRAAMVASAQEHTAQVDAAKAEADADAEKATSKTPAKE